MSEECFKCLLKELSEDDYYKNVYEYIASLDESVKTPDEVYEARLAICLSCKHLINGMCGLCGCFVEVRAAKKNNYCAKSREIW